MASNKVSRLLCGAVCLDRNLAQSLVSHPHTSAIDLLSGEPLSILLHSFRNVSPEANLLGNVVYWMSLDCCFHDFEVSHVTRLCLELQSLNHIAFHDVGI